MANENSVLYRWSPIFLSILRIVAGLLIMQHGMQKLFHFPPSGSAAGGALPPLMVAAGWIEFIGGILVVLGLFTHVAAFILSGEMAVAYFKHHMPLSPFPVINHGELAVALCFVFLYLAIVGGGSWSVDSLWRRRALAPTP